mgnify:FL=1
MRRAYISAAVVLIANAANGQTITAADAEQALFDPGPVEIAVLDLPFLSAEDKDVLGQIAMQQKYYGAIAFAPDDGLLSESLMGAFNYHDMTEARAAALKGCEAQRAGATPCAVVVELRPQGWEAGRALSLSGDATEAFNSQYSKAKGPKAMAISPSTGLFAVASDPAASGTATSACEALSQAGDCTVVLSE